MCLKHLDLCSGIGGFALGLQSTGCFKTIGFCEIDPFCQKVLKKNFPGVPIYSDIKEFKPNDEGLRPDIITSGFPCQPFSVAGKRKSEKDDRNLWKETLRVIQESRPAFFIGENVGGIVKLYLDTILEDLESANYSTRCFNISASSIGANHQRQRIWIVANSNSRKFNECSDASRICEEEQFRLDSNQKRNWNKIWSKTKRCSELSGETENVSDSENSGLQGYKLQTDLEIGRQLSKNSPERSIKEQQNWWQTFSKFHRIPNGISYGLDKDRTNRIKGLGNAIVPQIPFYIGQVIGRLYE
jgi:DNA (cytosine-5)-methyltransferase 1